MSETEMLDADGYPTEAALERIRGWPIADPKGWLEFCRSLWWAADWGWTEPEGEVSTGGWSGNEAIIGAMQHAQQGMLWYQVWWQTRRGGHYLIGLTKPRRSSGTAQEDTARLDWLEMAEADVKLRAIGVMADENEWRVVPLHRYGDPHPLSPGPIRPTLREAIDAARTGPHDLQSQLSEQVGGDKSGAGKTSPPETGNG